MSAILGIPTLELLRLWSELDDAFHGKNGFGGNVAEIYAYRLHGHRPMLCASMEGAQLQEEVRYETARQAGAALHDLLVLFQQERACKVTIEGALPELLLREGFSHRVHVKVTPQVKASK